MKDAQFQIINDTESVYERSHEQTGCPLGQENFIEKPEALSKRPL